MPSEFFAQCAGDRLPILGLPQLTRFSEWKGLFGQVGAAQSHLEKFVLPGDLFLFFGWFHTSVKGKTPNVLMILLIVVILKVLQFRHNFRGVHIR